MDSHFSYSRVYQYLRCSLAYRFKYLDGLEQEFLPAPLIFGVSFHRAAELFFRAKMDDRSIPSLDELHTTFRLAWEEQAKDSPEIRFKDGEGFEDQSQLARRMLDAFLEHVDDKDMQILAVEHRFSVEITPGMPPLLAYVDVIEQLPSGEICITEIKTSARKYSESQAFDSLQLSAYAAIAKALGHVGDVMVKYLVITKTKAPACQELVAVLDEGDIRRFTTIAEAVQDAVEKEAFVPNPVGWQCSGCQWQGACREELSRAA